ncbi:MAG: YidC/Oxa1 family membrane protein insertase [Thermomicrobia bacterium]|nr:YidC/Oxa1 family membrane protein insertase [Thermomicrobia bacterium]
MNHLPIIGPAIGLAARFIQTLGDITGGNLGITIILFTILIKLLLAPLTFKSIKSSKAMQDVAPIIKDLQKKYKDDKQAFAQEQMRVYQEYGINPLAGCLPVLIQLPVFLVVYQAMRQVSTCRISRRSCRVR